MYPFSDVESFDPEIAAAITAETNRQRENIELIASENLVSKAVMSAMGSTLTNKYAEGYPGKRYYGGCQHVDVVEDLARDRAMELFGCTYANVQPHSGAQAKYDCIFCSDESGRYLYGNESGSWRTSDTWKSCEPFRQIFPLCSLWCQ